MSAQRVTNIEEIRALPKGTSSVKGINLGDSEVLALRSLHSLKRLDLSGCDAVTDASVVELKALMELEELDLTLCMFISDASLEALTGLPKLRRLSLHGCYDITDQGLVALARSQSLEKLILWACEKLTDRGIESLAKLPTLRHLELPEFALISDVGLMALSDNAANLEMLRLDHLSAISDDGIRSLAQLKHLVRLLVQDCQQITASAIEALGMALPSCQIVFTS
jgi:hypothetical protein